MAYLGKYAVVLFILIVITHALATLNFWYWTFPWLDIPMHFVGGFWVAITLVYLDSRFNLSLFKEKNFFLNLLIIVSFVALIGVFWEFFEFIYDFFSNGDTYANSIEGLKVAQQGLKDTIGDLFFDLVGGTVFVFLNKIFCSNKTNL